MEGLVYELTMVAPETTLLAGGEKEVSTGCGKLGGRETWSDAVGVGADAAIDCAECGDGGVPLEGMPCSPVCACDMVVRCAAAERGMTSSEAYDCQAMMNAVAARGKMGACRSRMTPASCGDGAGDDGAGKGGGERKRWWRCAREIATRAATAGRLPLSSGCSAAVLLCCCAAVP
jgi:hypothetical protein